MLKIAFITKFEVMLVMVPNSLVVRLCYKLFDAEAYRSGDLTCSLFE